MVSITASTHVPKVVSAGGCNYWSSNPISGLTFCLFWSRNTNGKPSATKTIIAIEIFHSQKFRLSSLLHQRSSSFSEAHYDKTKLYLFPGKGKKCSNLRRKCYYIGTYANMYKPHTIICKNVSHTDLDKFALTQHIWAFVAFVKM